MNYINKQQGFTIVELLVVIVVIGVLAAITIVSYAGISQRALVSSLQSDLVNASKQLKMFNVEGGVYPSGNICPSPNATEICLKKSGANALSYQVNNSVNPQFFHIRAKNGNICYDINNNSSPTSIDCNWIPGIATTVMAGKYVYYQNIGTSYEWGSPSSCPTGTNGSQPCQIGLDSSYPAAAALISPQAYPTMDFSAYPPQNDCKTIGGRLPYTQELAAIYTNRVFYGNNFQNTHQWSATESSSSYSRTVNFSDGNTNATLHKENSGYVRCVRG